MTRKAYGKSQRIKPLLRDRIAALLARLSDSDPGLTARQIAERLQEARNAQTALVKNPELFVAAGRGIHKAIRWKLRGAK